MDTRANPPANPSTSTRTRTGRLWLVVVLFFSVLALDVTGLALLIHTSGRFDASALRLQHMGSALTVLGLQCLCMLGLLSAPWYIPSTQVLPRWWLFASWGLVVVLLLIGVSGFALYAFAPPYTLEDFAPPPAVGLASTLLLVDSMGMVVFFASALSVFATRRVSRSH